MLSGHEPLFSNTPTSDELITCAARNAEAASQDSLVGWLIYLVVSAIQSFAWRV